MRLFGFDINPAGELSKLKQQVRALEDSAVRLALQNNEALGSDGVRIPLYKYPPRHLYELAKASLETRTILLALRRETFRGGLLIEPEYACKCANCGEELQTKSEDAKCPTCASMLLVEPDSKKKRAFEKWSKCVNENEQNLLEVLQHINYDADVLDDGFDMITKEYFFDLEGNITSAEIKEVLRGDPLTLRIVADKTGRPGRNDAGEPLMTCVEHRHQVHVNVTRCPACQRQMFPAYFKADYESPTTTADGARAIYYIRGEVLHKSKYNPSLTYGHSPVATGWVKILTLLWQEEYIKDYYGKERPPRGLLFVNTSNVDSLMKSWQNHKEQQKKNPHDITPIGVSMKEGKKMVEWIEFVKPMQEMQYSENRNEYRRALGSLWGVQPIFQSDIQQSGGLNQEGLQISVTNRAIEAGQNYVNYFLGEIAKQFGMDGWKVTLAPVEIKDSMSDLLLENQKIVNAQGMKGLGFDVDVDEEGDFVFEKAQLPILPPALPANTAPNTQLPNEGTPEMSMKAKKKA